MTPEQTYPCPDCGEAEWLSDLETGCGYWDVQCANCGKVVPLNIVKGVKDDT